MLDLVHLKDRTDVSIYTRLVLSCTVIIFLFIHIVRGIGILWLLLIVFVLFVWFWGVLGGFFVVVLVGGGGPPPDTVISTRVIQHPSSLPKCRQSLKPYNKVKTQQHPKCFTIYETGNAP